MNGILTQSIVPTLGDYDLRGKDLDQMFARFGMHALRDDEILALSLASMVTPKACPGAEIYLLHVAHAADCLPVVRAWGMGVARGLAGAQYKGRGRVRRRALVEGYSDAWGKYAVYDAIMLIMYCACEGIGTRCTMLGVGKQGYRRIRDLVREMFAIAIAEYKLALMWALGYRRDSLLESRWGAVTGLKWDGENAHVTIKERVTKNPSSHMLHDLDYMNHGGNRGDDDDYDARLADYYRASQHFVR